jgi:hypothetical protein
LQKGQPASQFAFCNGILGTDETDIDICGSPGAAVVDPFHRQPDRGTISSFVPSLQKKRAIAYAGWVRARPLSRLAELFLAEVRKSARSKPKCSGN